MAAPADAPAPGDPMVEFIQHAAGPWGQMPGFKQMIETAMEANQVYVSSADARAPAAPSPAAQPTQDTAERLKRLDQLLEQGLVTADEHRELRQKIIDSI